MQTRTMEMLEQGPNAASTSSSSKSDATFYFDLETYIARYDPTSETRLKRLFFIGSRTNNEQVARMCLEMAESQLKVMGNTKVYREVFGMKKTQRAVDHDEQQFPNKNEYYSNLCKNPAIQINPNNYDSSWVLATDQAAQFQLETLHARLQTAQTHLAKEAIRTAYAALADFCKKRGSLKEAFTYILKSRDYCSTHLHTAETNLQAIELCFDMTNYAIPQFHSFLSKAQHAASALSSSSVNNATHNGTILMTKVLVAHALSLLNEGKYDEAAEKLTSVTVDLNSQFNTVVSSEDIVLYSVLLGLATFDRQRIQRVMFVDGSFATSTTVEPPETLKQRLSLLPWLSDLICHYVRAEYGQFLSLLEQHRSELLLDLRLSSHLVTLYDKIRNKCVVQYLKPYSSVNLNVMKCQFDPANWGNSTAEHENESSNIKLEDSVAHLITTGVIPHARINLQHGTIVTKQPPTRKTTIRHVEQLGDRFVRDAEAMLLRMACIESNITVQLLSSDSGHGKKSASSTRPGLSHYSFGSHSGSAYEGCENDVSSDSSNSDVDDEIMHAEEDNEAMDISDSVVENTQSA